MIDRWLQDAVAAHRAGRFAEAESGYRRVLEREPTHPQALVNLAMLYQGEGHLDAAIGCLANAASAGRLDASALNTLGSLYREVGRDAEALATYSAALDRDPHHVNARFNRAAVERALGDSEAAVETLRALVEMAPDDAEAFAELAMALIDAGAIEEAIERLRQALALNPDDPRTHFNLGIALGMIGAVEGAERAYREAVRREPRFAEAHNNLGLMFKARGETDAAIECFRAAVGANPGHVTAYLNWLDLSPAGLDFEAFERACRQALEAAPHDPQAAKGFARLLVHTGRAADALDLLRRALTADPDDAGIRFDLGVALQHAGDVDAAIECYRDVSELSQLYPLAQGNLAQCLQIQGHIEPAIAACRRALAVRPHDAGCHSNLIMCLNYRDGEPDLDLRAEHSRWARQHTIPAPRPAPARGERLVIGYVSGDFRSHPVADFIAPILRHHDRDRFEVVCYSNVARPDAFTDRLASLADRWCDIRALDDDAAATLVRADGVDILVDLAGHTADHRLGVFARRPAPVQIAYLGYPNTTGLECIDFRITDRWADPPGQTEAFHSERLLRLPSGFLCYRPESGIPAFSPKVDETEPFTFASFNNTSKVGEPAIAAWSDILRRVPGSRLRLKSRQLDGAGARGHLLERFAARGIDPERLVLEGAMLPYDEHLARYHDVDLALDPFPYGGTTTTCEALACGVPVVTLAGHAHRGRVGVSLLGRLGLDALVASSIDEYVDVAVSLASDAARRSAMAETVREGVEAGRLSDAATTTAELESALESAFESIEREASGQTDAPETARLNIGGTEAVPGWLNLNIVDGPQVDVVGDCRDLGAFEDASLDEIYTSHTLEHLGYEVDLPLALREINRVLRPGGALKVSVPDLEILSRKLLDPALDEGLRWQVMRMMFGGQIDEFDYHKVGLTFRSLRRLLRQAGFAEVYRVDRFGIVDDTSDGHIGGDPISLNVVARK